MAADILQRYRLRLNDIREELARSPMPVERVFLLPHEMQSELWKCGPVPDAETAKRIAEELWVLKYGADTVAHQAPLRAELKFNVWIVTGSSSTGAPLYAFIRQTDGCILSAGGWLPNAPDPD